MKMCLPYGGGGGRVKNEYFNFMEIVFRCVDIKEPPAFAPSGGGFAVLSE